MWALVHHSSVEKSSPVKCKKLQFNFFLSFCCPIISSLVLNFLSAFGVLDRRRRRHRWSSKLKSEESSFQISRRRWRVSTSHNNRLNYFSPVGTIFKGRRYSFFFHGYLDSPRPCYFFTLRSVCLTSFYFDKTTNYLVVEMTKILVHHTTYTRALLRGNEIAFQMTHSSIIRFTFHTALLLLFPPFYHGQLKKIWLF